MVFESKNNYLDYCDLNIGGIKMQAMINEEKVNQKHMAFK